jgi:hypothetical protein
MDASWRWARRIAEANHWLITDEQARAVGLSPAQVSQRVRSRGWRRLMRGVYLVDGDMYAQVTLGTWARAALLAHGANACLVGPVAATLQAAEGLPADYDVIDLALVGGVPRATRPADVDLGAPLVIVRQWPVAPDEVVEIDGMRMRRLEQTVVDAALLTGRVHGLCVFDWALRTGVVDRAGLDAVVAAAKFRPGIAAVRPMAALADGRAESPLESRVRLACVDGDIAPDELQYPVHDRYGEIRGYGDLAWLHNRQRPLIGEADGREEHTRPRAVLYDRRRGNSFVASACDIVRFTWADALRPAYIRSVVRAALAA